MRCLRETFAVQAHAGPHLIELTPVRSCRRSYTVDRPRMKCTTNEITARMMSRWIRPPATWNARKPSSHSTSSTTASPRNMSWLSCGGFGPAPDIARFGFPTLVWPRYAKIVEGAARIPRQGSRERSTASLYRKCCSFPGICWVGASSDDQRAAVVMARLRCRLCPIRTHAQSTIKAHRAKAVVDGCVAEKPDKLVRATWIGAVTYPICFVFRTDTGWCLCDHSPLNGPLA
jgi:hypothetical protein